MCLAVLWNLRNHNPISIVIANIVRLHNRDGGMSVLPQYHRIKVLIKFMQVVISSWGRCIGVCHYEYEIVNCGFWNLRRHFERAIYLMTKFILIELCWALGMTKPSGQPGRLSLGKKNCFDICLNTVFLLFFSWTDTKDMLFGAIKGMMLQAGDCKGAAGLCRT